MLDNLTGGQIQEILDTLIYESVAPIIRESTAFDVQVAYFLSVTARNKKRKLSSLPREQSIDTMCQYLCETNPERKVELVSKMRVERSFVYNFAVKFLQEVRDYHGMYVQYLRTGKKALRKQQSKRLRMIEASVGCSRKTLFSIISTTRDYLELAYTFRNKIVLQYVKHSYKQARSFVEMKGSNFDFQDVHQNFLAAVTKAVDKYDASKGALTSYINWWLLNAQTTSNSSHGHEYGIAYSIPQSQKKALAEKSSKALNVNFGVSLDAPSNGDEEDRTGPSRYISGSPSVEHEILENEKLVEVRALAKSADMKGIARLYLDIDEVFSKKEYRRMLRTMRKQLGMVPVNNGNGEIEFVVQSK